MNKSIIMGVWLDFKYQPDSEWRNYFLKLKKAGIEEIFVNANCCSIKISCRTNQKYWSQYSWLDLDAQ